MPGINSFVFFVLLVAMAAYWHTDLFQLVGSVVVIFTVSVAGTCFFSGPRLWLFRLIQSVAVLVCEPTEKNYHAETTEAEKKLRALVGVLEQQLLGTEAQVRDSEIAREIEKKRHEKEVRYLDSRLTNVSRGIKESLLAKDRVIVECRQWRRKFEDLEYLQQQAQENPVHGMKGRPRWDPAKNYGVGKGGRGRPAKKFTAIAQVAIVNAAWESKLVKFESEARGYVARTDDQIRSLHDAATALSNENACLQQQIQVTPDISHELVQQQVRDAVMSTMLYAEQQHAERVELLKQTYENEILAAKAEYERKMVAAIKAKEAAFVQQRKVAEKVATATAQASLGDELATKETQLDELRASNGQIASDLLVKDEEIKKLYNELGEETAKLIRLGQENDDYNQTGKRLRDENENLKSEKKTLAEKNQTLAEKNQTLAEKNQTLAEKNQTLAGDNETLAQENQTLAEENQALSNQNQTLAEEYEDLEEDVEGLDAACRDLAGDAERWYARSECWKGKTRELGQELADLRTADINQAIGGMGLGA